MGGGRGVSEEDWRERIRSMASSNFPALYKSPGWAMRRVIWTGFETNAAVASDLRGSREIKRDEKEEEREREEGKGRTNAKLVNAEMERLIDNTDDCCGKRQGPLLLSWKRCGQSPRERRYLIIISKWLSSHAFASGFLVHQLGSKRSLSPRNCSAVFDWPSGVLTLKLPGFERGKIPR